MIISTDSHCMGVRSFSHGFSHGCKTVTIPEKNIYVCIEYKKMAGRHEENQENSETMAEQVQNICGQVPGETEKQQDDRGRTLFRFVTRKL